MPIDPNQWSITPDVNQPLNLNEWDITPDPPQANESFWGNIFSSANAARLGLSAAGDAAGASAAAMFPPLAWLTYPTISAIGGGVGEAAGQYLGDEPFNPWMIGTEALLNPIFPGPNLPGRGAGLKAAGEFALGSAKAGAKQGFIGSFPRHIASSGEWELPGVGEVAGQTALGYGLGGLIGGATAGAAHLRGGPNTQVVDDIPPNLKQIGSGSTSSPPPPAGAAPPPPPTSMDPYVDVSINDPATHAELQKLGYVPFSVDQSTVRFRRKDLVDQPTPEPVPTESIPEPNVPEAPDEFIGVEEIRREFGTDPYTASKNGFIELFRDDSGRIGFRRTGKNQAVTPVEASPEPTISEAEVEAKYRMPIAQAVQEQYVERVVRDGETGYLDLGGIGGFRHIGDEPHGGAANETPGEQEIRAYLSRMLGRPATDDEVARAIDRQAREGDFTGRVVDFPTLTPEQQADLDRVNRMLSQPGEPVRPPVEQRIRASEEATPPGDDFYLYDWDDAPPPPPDSPRRNMGIAIPGVDQPRPPQMGQQDLSLGPVSSNTDELMRQMAPKIQPRDSDTGKFVKGPKQEQLPLEPEYTWDLFTGKKIPPVGGGSGELYQPELPGTRTDVPTQRDITGQGELFDSNKVYIPEKEALGVTNENQLPLKLQSEAYWKKHLEGTKSALNEIDRGLAEDGYESSISHDYARMELKAIPDGPPGLTQTGGELVYRGPDGKPVAYMYVGGMYKVSAGGTPDIITFVADKSKGLLYGRAVFAIAKKAGEMGALTSGSGYSKHSANFARKIKKFAVDPDASFDVEAFKSPTQMELPDGYKGFGGIRKVDPETGEVYSRGGSGDEPPSTPRPGDPPVQPPGNVPPDQVPPGSRPPIPDEPPASAKKAKTDDPKEKSFWQHAYDAVRSLTTGMDISAPMRQGLPLIATKSWWTSWGTMIKAWGNQAAYDANLKSINDHYLFKSMELANGQTIKGFAQRMGLRIDEFEEATASRIIEQYIPGMKASSRAYNAYLKKLRADTFINLIEDAKRQGENPFTDETLARSIAEFVNTASGAASLKMDVPSWIVKSKSINLEQSAKQLSYLLFSPRQTFSRARMLNPMTYTQAPPFVRQQYMKALFSSLGAWSTIAGAASLSGYADEVSLDPTSADFGKIRIGNTRLDVGGGFQQYMVAAARLLSGQRTTAASSGGPSRTQVLGEGYQARTGLDVAQLFISNKLHPLTKFGYDMLNASEYQPFHVGDKMAQIALPLYMQDAYEIIRQDRPEILPLLIPAAIGMGTQTYEAGEATSRIVPEDYDYIYTGGERPWSGLYRR